MLTMLSVVGSVFSKRIDKILLDAARLEYERVEARCSWTSRRRQVLVACDFTARESWPRGDGQVEGITFKTDPSGPPSINNAREEDGASVWPPNKDQWRDEGGNQCGGCLVDVSNGKFEGKRDLWDRRALRPLE
jgi:hypothetical protein